MAFIARQNEFGVQATGSVVTVADHPVAKLMYYLDVISGLLDLRDTIPARLRDYINHHRLTAEETLALLRLVLLLGPEKLIGEVLFQNDELCGDSNNEFYELSQVSHTLAVRSSLIIGGQERRVFNVMTFKVKWIQDTYIVPLAAFQALLAKANERESGCCCAIL